MTGVEPEVWVGDPAAAIDFYAPAFEATVLHRVCHDTDLVAQLAVGEARFWVSNSGARRLSPLVAGGTTDPTLLVVEDPDVVRPRAPSPPALS
jgi:uncharacterized glyoxalase superfamily protein PhnB